MNGKPHTFNGTEGVVGLRRWIEKVEQVFETCKCAEEDKVMFAARVLSEVIKEISLLQKPATPHDALNMAVNGRQETARAYAAAPTENIGYAGNLPKMRRVMGVNPNVVMGTFLLNDHYACILFDSGAKKSFVSSAFTPFIDIAPTDLNTSYEVELADGKVNCYEKISVFPLLNGEILEVQGERPEKDPGSLACIKADEKKLDDIRLSKEFPEKGKVGCDENGMCYRELNKLTIKNRYPLPRIDDLFDQLQDEERCSLLKAILDLILRREVCMPKFSKLSQSRTGDL
ncbi:hypothetical protein Tco_0121408 [Tanacetum coccineum]